MDAEFEKAGREHVERLRDLVEVRGKPWELYGPDRDALRWALARIAELESLCSR